MVLPVDKAALTDAIKKLLLDEGLRKRLGEAEKKRAEDFNVEKIVRQYEQVIEDLCRASVAD